jgi:hypothetical protein
VNIEAEEQHVKEKQGKSLGLLLQMGTREFFFNV